MDTEKMKRPNSTTGVASGWNVALGIWVLISPFALDYTQNPTFVWNNVVLGIVIGILALVRGTGSDPRGVCSWLNVLLGIWLVISPFVLGFFNLKVPLWNNVILGIVIALIALASTSGSRRPLPASPSGP